MRSGGPELLRKLIIEDFHRRIIHFLDFVEFFDINFVENPFNALIDFGFESSLELFRLGGLSNGAWGLHLQSYC